MESHQIAIESARSLLPTVEFIERLTNDLNAIRFKFPDTTKVNHIPKWEPGVLFLTDVKADTIERINRSEYGPVEAQSILGNDLYKAMFRKPYNPEVLAGLLKAELGIPNAEPNWVTGRSTYITVTEEKGNENVYIFRKSRKPCNFACDNVRTTVFQVKPGSSSVELISDSGVHGDIKTDI